MDSLPVRADGSGENDEALTLDLSFVGELWWPLVVMDATPKQESAQVSRRWLEICVFTEVMRELKFSPKVIWRVVKEKAKICEIPGLAPHDLRRTCARLCHQAGGELEQIQFLLGHVSVQTTERYLGCKQRFHNAVNDRGGIEPDPPGKSWNSPHLPTSG